MRIVEHDSPQTFLARARATLLADEVRGALVLGIAGELERHLGAGLAPLLATVERGDEVVAVAVRTPPFPLIVYGADHDALAALAAELARDEADLPGVTGHLAAAEAFAAAWPHHDGADALRRMHMRYYALRAVVPPRRPAPGALRLASADEVPWLCDWVATFTDDTGMAMEAETAELRHRRVLARVNDGTVYVWDDGGEPAALASVAGKTPNGVRVNMVYTPAERRGRGYASACVAALAQRMLDAGNAFVSLYADRDAPQPNRIYQRVGFEWVCDAVLVRFDQSV